MADRGAMTGRLIVPGITRRFLDSLRLLGMTGGEVGMVVVVLSWCVVVAAGGFVVAAADCVVEVVTGFVDVADEAGSISTVGANVA